MHINDLLEAYFLAITKIEVSNGKIYNIGGGIENSYSLLEMLDLISIYKNPIFEINNSWRQGDQKYFVSNNQKIMNELGWKIEISTKKGLEILNEWVNKIL